MTTQNSATYDFIVVGGGSAGSVLAARLSERGDSVLLLEAGREKHPLPYDLPFLAAKLFSMKANNWAYTCVPQPHMNGRIQFFPRGKLLGGSFIFNGAQYVRGHPSDFDHWRQLGNAGWSYDDVLPYFRKSEDYRGTPDEYHGTDGPLAVSKPPAHNPLSNVYLQACAEAGYDLNDDFNGGVQEGFGIYDFNVAGGRRMTTARAFLKPVRSRSNLHIITEAMVRRVLFDGRTATGVEFERGETIEQAHARREIVLAAGSINTPKILMLSGLGDPDDLGQHGISTTHALPGVGRNLQDHVNVMVGHAATQPVSFAKMLRAHNLTLEMMKGLFLKKGQMTQSPLEAGGFFSTRDDQVAPMFQAVFVPYHAEMGMVMRKPWAPRLDGHSFAVHVWPNRPESRGSLTLASADPDAAPILDPNFLSEESDVILTREAIRETRRIFSQTAFDPWRGDELSPGADVRSDNELDTFVRSTSGIGHHTCGTTKMGQDPMAVVDERLCVHGIANLRVADASIMPTLVSGNTNAATIMIAEKAAAMMLDHQILG